MKAPESTTDLAYDDPTFVHQFDSSNPLVWCNQEIDGEIQSITIPGNLMEWAGGPSGFKCNIPHTTQIAYSHMILTFERRPGLKSSTLMGLVGKINSGTFLGRPDETIFMHPVKTSRRATTDGAISQRIQVKLSWREVSWNKALRPDTGVWDYPQWPGLPPIRRYEKADFSPLYDL